MNTFNHICNSISLIIIILLSLMIARFLPVDSPESLLLLLFIYLFDGGEGDVVHYIIFFLFCCLGESRHSLIEITEIMSVNLVECVLPEG